MSGYRGNKMSRESWDLASFDKEQKSTRLIDQTFGWFCPFKMVALQDPQNIPNRFAKYCNINGLIFYFF